MYAMFAKVRLVLGTTVCLAAATLVGCGPSGPEIATVEGTITMDGKPLANASVVFMPENGRPAGAWTDENGHYVLNFNESRQGAIPGKNRVRISTMRDPMEDDEGKMIPGSKETVPMKYNTHSELTFTVEDGKKNIADFQLDSEGQVADQTQS